MQGSNTEKIIEQVRKCPSGALHYFMNMDAGTGQPEIISEATEIINIQIKPNGPILINTDCHITHSNGTTVIKKGATALCRCGASANKPYCDGTHKTIDFKG